MPRLYELAALLFGRKLSTKEPTSGEAATEWALFSKLLKQ
jgi:hypothetical protein